MSIVTEEVFYRSGDGKCAADLYRLNTMIATGGRRPAIVIGHGFNMVKEALVDAAQAFVKAGYIVLAIDYRRFGRSPGQPRNLLKPLDEVEDYRNGISYLQDRLDVDPERIGIWGVSFSGGIVLHTAAIDRRVRCVVVQSPANLDGRQSTADLYGAEAFARLLDKLQQDHIRRALTGEGERVPCVAPIEKDVFPVLPGDGLLTGFIVQAAKILASYRIDIPLESLEHMMAWAPIHSVELIAPTPLLIVTNGGYDLHHRLDRIQDAFRRAGEPKRLTILPYDVVGLYAEPGLGESMRHAIAWFDQHLGAAASAALAAARAV